MSGPIPKSPSKRQRRNKSVTAATLTETAALMKAPALPDLGREWHPMTRAWWSDSVTGIWASPMAKEYDNSDVHGLFSLAMLVDDFWSALLADDRKQLMAEIRLQSQRYGLSPIDRRRLQWEIARGEDAEKKRKAYPPTPANDGKVRDSRDVLRAV